MPPAISSFYNQNCSMPSRGERIRAADSEPRPAQTAAPQAGRWARLSAEGPADSEARPQALSRHIGYVWIAKLRFAAPGPCMACSGGPRGAFTPAGPGQCFRAGARGLEQSEQRWHGMCGAGIFLHTELRLIQSYHHDVN